MSIEHPTHIHSIWVWVNTVVLGDHRNRWCCTMFIPPATNWIHSGNPQVFCWGNVCMDQKSSKIEIVILLYTIHGWIFYKVIDPQSGPKNVRVTILMTIIIIIILHLYLVGIDDIWWSSFLCWWLHFIIFLWHYEFQQKHQDIPRSFHQIPTPSPFFP